MTVRVNGSSVEVGDGVTVAAAVLASGAGAFRRSANGEPRGAMCGMGVCFECRVTIDGRAHKRSCQVMCRPGMEIVTDA